MSQGVKRTSVSCRTGLPHELAGLYLGARQSGLAQHGESERHVLPSCLATGFFENYEEGAGIAPPVAHSDCDNRTIVVFGIGVFHAGQNLHDIEIAIPEGRFTQVFHQ